MNEHALATLDACLLDPKDVVVFAGSGLSITCGYPSWSSTAGEWIPRLTKLGMEKPVLDYVKLLLSNRDYYGAFDVARKHLPEATYIQNIISLFGCPASKPSDVHLQLCRAGIAGAITTNFDSLIETAFTCVHERQPRLATYFEEPRLSAILSSPNDFFVLKLHGDLTMPKRMVLTQSQCAEVTRSTLIRDILADIISRRQLLVLGYGLGDPDFLELWKSVLSKREMTNPALLVLPEGELPIPEVQLSEMNLHLVRFENTDGKFEFVSQVLDHLHGRSEHGSDAPMQVTSILPSDALTQIDQYVVLFDRLTQDHSDRLGAFVSALCLAELMDSSGTSHVLPLLGLRKRIRKILKVRSEDIESHFQVALRKLQEEGLAIVADDQVELVAGVAAKLRSAHTTLKESEQDILRSVLRSVKETSPSDGEVTTFLELVDEILLWLGRSLAEQVLFARFPEDDERHRIEEIVEAFAEARKLPSELYRKAADRLLYGMTDVEEAWFFRKLQAHFLISAYVLHPSSERLMKGFLARHVLYLDSSIVLPALANGHLLCRTYSALLQRSREMGIQLRLREEMGREVISHLRRGIRQFEDLDGPHFKGRLEAYSLCTGEGHGNVFVEGYLGALRVGSTQSWPSYVGHLIRSQGGRHKPDVEKVWGHLQDVLGISRDATPLAADSAAIDGLADRISDIREGRRQNRRAGYILSRSEAAQFLRIHELRKESPADQNTIWFLTTDTHIARLQQDMRDKYPMPIMYYPHRWSQYVDSIDCHDRGARDFSHLMQRVEYGTLTGVAAVAVVKRFTARLQQAKLDAAEGRIAELIQTLLRDYHLKNALVEANRRERLGLPPDVECEIALERAAEQFVIKTEADWKTIERNFHELEKLHEEDEREKESLAKRLKAKDHHIGVLRGELKKRRG